jgi:hypothetical protein
MDHEKSYSGLFKKTTCSEKLVEACSAAHLTRLKTVIMVSSCNKQDSGYFRFRPLAVLPAAVAAEFGIGYGLWTGAHDAARCAPEVLDHGALTDGAEALAHDAARCAPEVLHHGAHADGAEALKLDKNCRRL